MTLWIISDTHFGDASLIAGAPTPGAAPGAPPKTARPFTSLAEMDDCLADSWAERVAPTDTVLHLGDVYAGAGWPVLARLPGHKHLILGNHDDPSDPHLRAAFASIGLWNVTAAPGIALTHLPMDLSRHSGLGARFGRNIHGHLHLRPAPTPRHLCVSVEQTGYAPVPLEELLATG